MAKGYPDFFGFQTFPQYGVPAFGADDTVMVAAGDTASVFVLTCKGRISGGYIFLSGAVEPSDLVLKIYVDGDLTETTRPHTINSRGIYRPGLGFLYMVSYRPETDAFLLGLTTDLTFVYSYEITLTNDGGVAEAVSHFVYYHVVQ